MNIHLQSAGVSFLSNAIIYFVQYKVLYILLTGQTKMMIVVNDKVHFLLFLF